jgi:RNA polymerase sigma-70 factor (ECF subfamily)
VREVIGTGVIEAEGQYREWMLAGLAGDTGAYRKLLAALGGHLRAYFARRVGPSAAEDLVQETLIAMHSRRATYEPSQPLTAWVYGIARYKLIDEYRRTRRRASVPLDEAPDLFAADAVESAGAKRDVEKLMATLPEGKRALVRAIKLDGASVAEAAAASGLSESAVKVTVHRAIKSLGEDVTRDEGRGDEH